MDKFIKILDVTLKLIGTTLGIGLCAFVGGMISLIVFMFFTLLFMNTQPTLIVIPFPIKICISIFFLIFWVVSSIQFFMDNKRKGETR